MFVVQNLTDRTVILSDLHAEIGPRKVLDLEFVATRNNLDSSRDLQKALNQKQLAVVKYTNVQDNIKQPQIKMSQPIDESKLTELIRKTIDDRLKEHKQTNIESTVQKAVQIGVNDLITTIRDQINNLQPIQTTKGESKIKEPIIDPDKIAAVSQKAIEKMNEEMESSGQGKQQKINIINKNLDKLAGEL